MKCSERALLACSEKLNKLVPRQKLLEFVFDTTANYRVISDYYRRPLVVDKLVKRVRKRSIAALRR